jgi:glyoxylase-like metal-dependent hydrolase (beta-lactamase superfamily II)
MWEVQDSWEGEPLEDSLTGKMVESTESGSSRPYLIPFSRRIAAEISDQEIQMNLRILAPILFLSVVVSGAAFAAEPFSEPPLLDKPQAGYYRLKIGKTDVVAVNDGATIFDVLSVIPKQQKAAAEKVMANSLVRSPLVSSINAFIILRGGKTILVDAGAGGLMGVKLGKIPDSLREAGLRAEDVTDILVTHIHPDHTGGLMFNGKNVFPNATMHVNKKELDFWTDKSAAAKATGPTKDYFAQAAATVMPYVSSGRVQTFEGETEIMPGIRSMPAYGHTPGHTFYVLEDSGQKLVFMGDTINAPDAQITNPSITVAFDVDQKAAAVSRQKAFADAAKGGYFVAFAHMHFPGIGRIKKEGVGYRWLPITYINDAPRR